MRGKQISAIFSLIILGSVACSGTGIASPIIPPTSPMIPSTVSATPNLPTLSLTQTPTLTPTASATPTFRVNLVAVGDIMLARGVGDQILTKGPQVVFSGVQSILDEADIRVGNLECAITGREISEKKSYPLKAPIEAAQALSLAKFDLLSLANNHSMDFGFTGLVDTQEVLSQVGIATIGAGLNASAAHAPLIIERNGLRIAFLAYADVLPEGSGFDTRSWIASASQPGIAWADPEQIMVDVASARLKTDLVVVLLHAGYELNTSVSLDQRRQAHAAIDAGAALVLGSHSHILQPIEQYHGGLIAYSLGNFVFDQYEGIVNASIILNVVLDRAGVANFGYTPILIVNGLPEITPIETVRGIETLVAPVSGGTQ